MGELVYPMSIADYRPDWGLWEALREAVYQEYLDLFQDNWTVERHGGMTRVEGRGPTFDLESLILGVSSKRGKDLRGEHGEGTKMGWMVLLREGIGFELQSGDKAFWAEEIELHGKTCMKVCWRELPEPFQGARYELLYDGPMFEERIVRAADRIFTAGNGASILNVPGLFAKGIWVQNGRLISDLAFGYDFQRQKLDLSRKMVSEWDARNEMGDLWAEVEDLRLVKRFLQAVTENMGERYAYLGQPEHNEVWREAWKELFGSEACVETGKTASREATWRGAKMVEVGGTLKVRLGGIVGTDRSYVEKRTQAGIAYIPDRSLNSEQRRRIRWCRSRVERFYPGYSVQAAELRYDSGTIDREKRLILLRPEVLEDALQAAEVTAHELDHLVNGTDDLSPEQVTRVTRLAVKLFGGNIPY